jgi:hypothetical protein
LSEELCGGLPEPVCAAGDLRVFTRGVKSGRDLKYLPPRRLRYLPVQAPRAVVEHRIYVPTYPGPNRPMGERVNTRKCVLGARHGVV